LEPENKVKMHSSAAAACVFDPYRYGDEDVILDERLLSFYFTPQSFIGIKV